MFSNVATRTVGLMKHKILCRALINALTIEVADLMWRFFTRFLKILKLKENTNPQNRVIPTHRDDYLNNIWGCIAIQALKSFSFNKLVSFFNLYHSYNIECKGTFTRSLTFTHGILSSFIHYTYIEFYVYRFRTLHLMHGFPVTFNITDTDIRLCPIIK